MTAAGAGHEVDVGGRERLGVPGPSTRPIATGRAAVVDAQASSSSWKARRFPEPTAEPSFATVSGPAPAAARGSTELGQADHICSRRKRDPASRGARGLLGQGRERRVARGHVDDSRGRRLDLPSSADAESAALAPTRGVRRPAASRSCSQAIARRGSQHPRPAHRRAADQLARRLRVRARAGARTSVTSGGLQQAASPTTCGAPARRASRNAPSGRAAGTGSRPRARPSGGSRAVAAPATAATSSSVSANRSSIVLGRVAAGCSSSTATADAAHSRRGVRGGQDTAGVASWSTADGPSPPPRSPPKRRVRRARASRRSTGSPTAIAGCPGSADSRDWTTSVLVLVEQHDPVAVRASATASSARRPRGEGDRSN